MFLVISIIIIICTVTKFSQLYITLKCIFKDILQVLCQGNFIFVVEVVETNQTCIDGMGITKLGKRGNKIATYFNPENAKYLSKRL